MNMFKKEFEVCLHAIKEASKEIMHFYQKGFNVNYKQDDSEVTDADYASNVVIVSLLQENFPDYAILSEESKDNKERLNNDYCFIIDPLDGTRDFVHHDDMFAINLALAYKHEIVLGLICVPCKNIIYYAIKGEGAYKIENDEVTRIHTNNKTNDLTMLTSCFFFKHQEEFSANPYIKELKGVGSSYKVGLIAEGKAEFCIKLDNHSKEWDTAPMEVIIREAGGFMTDYHGVEMQYNRDNVVNEDGFMVVNTKENIEKFKR